MSMFRQIWILPALIASVGISSLVVFGASSAPMASDQGMPPTIALIDDDDAPSPSESDLKTREAVDKGLALLAGMQEDDGSWKNDIGLKLGESYRVEKRYESHVGVTALCCMALVAGGSTPDSGPYSSNVSAGLSFLIRNQQTNGQFQAFGSRMYSHAFATLFVAEIYGMTRDTKIGEALRAAIQFIVKNQVKPPKDDQYDGVGGRERLQQRFNHINAVGGWRYEPGQLDADMSITVCQLQALRAAQNSGIHVDRAVIDSARAYVANNYISGGSGYSEGGFMYQPSMSTGRDSFALAAAGVVALQSVGNYDTYVQDFDSGARRVIDLRASIQYIKRYRPDSFASYRADRTDYAFWYGHYYAAQAFRQFANVSEQEWINWNRMNRTHFLRMQESLGTGGWIDEVGNHNPTNNAFATAMACLILSIPNEYLPIFQH